VNRNYYVGSLDTYFLAGESGVGESQKLRFNVRLSFKSFRETRVKKTFPMSGMLEDKDLANPKVVAQDGVVF
jgi:hypothetical protein